MAFFFFNRDFGKGPLCFLAPSSLPSSLPYYIRNSHLLALKNEKYRKTQNKRDTSLTKSLAHSQLLWPKKQQNPYANTRRFYVFILRVHFQRFGSSGVTRSYGHARLETSSEHIGRCKPNYHSPLGPVFHDLYLHSTWNINSSAGANKIGCGNISPRAFRRSIVRYVTLVTLVALAPSWLSSSRAWKSTEGGCAV